MAYLRALNTLDKPTSFALGTSQTIYRGQGVIQLATDGLAYGTYTSGAASILGLAMDNIASSIYEKLVATYYTTVTVDASGNGTATSIATGRTLKANISADTLATNDGWVLKAKKTTDAAYAAVTTTQWTVEGSASAGTITVKAVAATGYASETGVSLELTAVLDVLKSGIGFTTVEDQFDNSTTGSGKVTVFWSEGEYETDQYNPLEAYAAGNPLYMTAAGIITANATGALDDAASAAIVIGSVLRAPSLSLTAETRVTDGHSNPRPEALKLFFRKPVVAVAGV